mgnify:CR=1 FL=1
MPSSNLSDSSTQERSALRQHMRKQRAQLSPLQQRLAALRLAHQLAHHPRLRKAQHIGLYVGHRGELDPWRCAALWQQDKSLYLPTLHPDRSHRLLFVPAGTRWRRNRFGIREPMWCSRNVRPLWRLDVLLIPLLAFDRNGGRLGMGGGYYDRTLASLPTWAKRPWCIGIGYRFQERDQLPLAGWDQRLDDIITD